MDLNEISVFIKVVQLGSFSGAARSLEMPLSTVSHKVASLEKRLGLNLIQRTTRKLHITPVGLAYFKKCVEALSLLQGAEVEVTMVRGEPSGLLRITTFYELASSVLPELISAYTKKFPKVRIEVLVTDRVVDLISENVDLAIRAGDLKDSSLKVKKIGINSFGLFASPKYIKARGTPQHPRQLIDFDCLQFTPLGTKEWRLQGPNGEFSAPLQGRIVMNNLSALKKMAENGDGIGLLPIYFTAEEVRTKKLVRVLENWGAIPTPISFVYVGQKFTDPKISAFIDMAMEPLRKSLAY